MTTDSPPPTRWLSTVRTSPLPIAMGMASATATRLRPAPIHSTPLMTEALALCELSAADCVHNLEAVVGPERGSAIFAAGQDLAVALDDGHGGSHPLAGEKIVDCRTSKNRDRLPVDDDFDHGSLALGSRIRTHGHFLLMLL